MPMLFGTPPSVWYARKAAARYGYGAPSAYRPLASIGDFSPSTVRVTERFDGMADSAIVCPYYGSCQPPDMAVASSSSWTLQGVNTAFSVYSPSGLEQLGWPKNAAEFFGVPNPGTCDPAGPFMSNPRAFYDPVGGRFWAAALQVEGAFNINNCPEQSLYWVAVSQTSDPRGAWYVYAFEMRSSTTNVADFTQIGLDDHAFYFSGNMYNQTGTTFQYAEVFAADKAEMERGQLVVARGLKKIQYGKTMIDSLQPVLVEGPSPAAGLFAGSFNIESGGGNCLDGCSGINVYAMADALTAPKFTYKQASSMNYSLAPLADQPGCMDCLETFDTRITQTPVYAGGLITFALNTGVKNGTQVVPATYWGQVQTVLSGTTIQSAKMFQQGLLSFAGDQAAIYGAAMPDASNDVAIVFDTMSKSINPGSEYAVRVHTDLLGTFETPQFLKHGQTATGDTRWGEYSAVGFEGKATDQIWLAGEYGALGGDWATQLAALQL